jgi:hypothetical protein
LMPQCLAIVVTHWDRFSLGQPIGIAKPVLVGDKHVARRRVALDFVIARHHVERGRSDERFHHFQPRRPPMGIRIGIRHVARHEKLRDGWTKQTMLRILLHHWLVSQSPPTKCARNSPFAQHPPQGPKRWDFRAMVELQRCTSLFQPSSSQVILATIDVLMSVSFEMWLTLRPRFDTSISASLLGATAVLHDRSNHFGTVHQSGPKYS